MLGFGMQHLPAADQRRIALTAWADGGDEARSPCRRAAAFFSGLLTGRQGRGVGAFFGVALTW